MLVLTREPGQKIIIDGGIVVTIIEVKGSRVRIGVEAPPDTNIQRPEAVKPPRDKR